MFTNKNGCTVYERTVQNRAPAFIRHELGAVYWEENTGQKNGSDRAPDNETFISIPVTSGSYFPRVGDKIIGEVIADESPPPEALTVMKTADCRYGSPAVQHWEATAK